MIISLNYNTDILEAYVTRHWRVMGTNFVH